MKIRNKILTLSLLTAGFLSCSNEKKANEKTATIILKEYVDSTTNAPNVYTTDNWVLIDSGYQERALKAEAAMAEMTEDDKAAYETSKKNYADLKAKYEVEIAKLKASNDPNVKLRNNLFGEGKVGDDMQFDFVNATNMLSVYQSFVDAVDANKKEYSREDWDEIKLLYEALDTHKNRDEKTLKTADNLKIAGLKMKFAKIYDANRPGSKVRENVDAKS